MSPHPHRDPIAKTRSGPVWTPLTYSASHAEHRYNLRAYAHGRYQPHLPFINVYNTVAGYLRTTLEMKGRLSDLEALLKALFGLFAGSWLHSNLYNRKMPFDEFDTRLAEFKDTHFGTKPDYTRLPALRGLDAYTPPPPNPEHTMTPAQHQAKIKRETAPADLAFLREEQFANRTALAARLIQRQGVVDPKRFATYWMREQPGTKRYEKKDVRLTRLLGREAVAILDTTEPTNRVALADALRAVPVTPRVQDT